MLGTFARRQCVLSRLLRWKRSWATCPDQVVVRLIAKRGRCKQMHVYEVRPRKDRRFAVGHEASRLLDALVTGILDRAFKREL